MPQKSLYAKGYYIFSLTQPAAGLDNIIITNNKSISFVLLVISTLIEPFLLFCSIRLTNNHQYRPLFLTVHLYNLQF